MSKFKRALSAILAIAIVFGMFSCLAPATAPIASAEEVEIGSYRSIKTATATNDELITVKSDGIPTYADLVANYGTATDDSGVVDGFLYIGAEYYEDDGTLTDYNVQPGETLTARVYIKSNMYTADANIISFFDNTYWDVKKAAADVTSFDANGYTSGFVTDGNTEHPAWTTNGYTNAVTSINITNAGWIKNTCGFDTDYLTKTDLVQVQSMVNSGVSSAAYRDTSDIWKLTYIVTVKEDVPVGTNIYIESPDVIWASYINPSTSKHDTRKRAYIANSHPDVHTTTTTVSTCKTMAAQMDNGYLDYAIRDLEKTFLVTESDDVSSGGGSTSAPITYEADVIKYDGTSTTITTDKIIPYADLVADYGTNVDDSGIVDGFLYIAAEYYEADGNPTDYYVQPGDTLTARVYIKSNMYTADANIISFFDNNYWDVKKAAEGVTSFDANGYTSGFVTDGNKEHPAWTTNGYTNAVTSINITNAGWIKNTCGFDTEYLTKTDLVQVQSMVDSGVSSAAYRDTSDIWKLTYIVTVKEGLADGTEFYIESPDVIWASYINPSTGKHDTRKRAYIANAHPDVHTTTTTVSTCKTMAAQMDNGYLDYFIRGLDYTFHIGEPPAAGTYTATFTVDGATYDSASYATGAEIAAPETAPSKDGYTFLGWAAEGTDTILTFPQTMGSANVTYVAVFAEVAKYTATFVVDGTTVSEEEYAEGATIVAPADPTKTGYTFAGWNPTVGTMGAADITFTAQWTAKTYNVSYYKETTDTAAYQTLTATYDAAYTLPTAPTKTGYTFNKWVDADGADMPATHTVAGDVSYYASWTAGTFNATFNANGGSWADGDTTKAVPTVFGEAIVAPADPTRTGYEFAGWSPAVGNMTAEGLTFTAQWTAAQIGVHFMDGDEELALLTGSFGSDIAAMSPNPSKDGYTFKGWQYADGTTADFPITLGSEAVYVYAVWDAKSYYIEWYNGSSFVDGYSLLCGNAMTAPEAPSKTGSTFVGWFDADGNAMPETVPAIDNQVYYAQYEATKYAATFYVDSTKAEVHDTYEGTYQSVIPAPADPVKEGYTFKHWSKDGSTSKVTFSSTAPKMPLNGIDYVAQWTINSYDIVYYVDGVEVNRETYTYGAAITEWTYTPAEGESFSGWGDQVPATMPAGEVSVYGTTGTATYTVTFTIDGEEYQTIEVAYGAAITVPTVEDKEGYTFSGWDVPEKMPAGNQTYDATYTVNTYTVNFWLDDAKTELYKTFDLAYGATIEYPAAPEVAGKEFIDWDNTPATVPANNVDIIAMFNNIEYMVEFYVDGEIVAEDIVYYNDEVTAPEDPAKEGYDFIGWFVNGVQATFPYAITEDTAFEAVFDVQSLKVVYYVYGADGSVQSDYDAYEFGAAITLRDPLTKEGYTFSGWKDADGNDAVLPETMPAEDITVYGTWTVNQYPVTFNAGEGAFADGSKEITIDVDYGTTPAAPETPTLAGYGFAGWDPALAPVGVDGATYTAKFSAGLVNYTVETYTMDTTGAYGDPVVDTKSGETDATVSETPVAAEGFTVDEAASVLSGVVAADGSTVLKVYYIRNQYDLTISIDGVDETNTYYYEEAIPAVEAPAKVGYTFEGWSEAIPATMPAADTTITAIFTVNQYTITFAETGDVAYEAITQDYGTAVGDIADPVKTGYTFLGWDKEIPATIPAEDLTITAIWEINEYTITYRTWNGVYHSETYEYGAEIQDVDDPLREGYTFKGWDNEIPETMPAENVTISAIWEVNYYDAKFIIEGQETLVSTAYGEVPVAPTPTKVGYTFTGWAEGEVVKMVVGGATYTAVFEANTYDAIFDAAGGKWDDGATTQTVPTVFDTAIVAPADPTREAYIFAGWSPAVGNMTTEGITFTAQWTNDTSFCRVQNVELINPTTLTSITKAAYEITVMESPVKVQIAGGEDYTFTWTYDRLDETVPGDLSEAGLVAIKAYNAADELITDDSTDKTVAYEKWTIVTMLSEGAYKVRAKVGYTSADWEEIATAYDYSVEFADQEAASDIIKSVTPAENVVLRGNTSTITVVADSSVTRLRLVMDKADGTSLTVSYSPSATTYATVTDNGDGTSTWVLSMRFTYTGTDLEQDQKWTVWYRTDGASSWLETDKAAEVKVTKYEQTDSPSTSYEAYSIVSVTAPTDAVKATYAPVVVVTTSDVTKVRLGYNGKTSTYLQTSNNVTYVDNGDGTATWTINYRFATAGEQTWTAQCRGNKWSEATEFTFTVAEA